MRRVLYKKWIPAEHYQDGVLGTKVVKGTACFESEFKNKGVFHAWGLDYIESEDGNCSYTIALVETFYGGIVSVLPSNIKFVGKD